MGLKIVIIEVLLKEQVLIKFQVYVIFLLLGKILVGLGVWENIKDFIGYFECI